MLRTADDRYTIALFRPATEGGLWHRWDVAPRVPDGIALEASVAVRVNEGRWIIECPCGGAQLATRDQDRFFCIDCLNLAAGGLWVPVVWPDDPEAIETVLLKRDDPRNRNWLPSETVSDLEVENDTRGKVVELAHMVAPGTEVHPDSEVA